MKNIADNLVLLLSLIKNNVLGTKIFPAGC